MNAIKLSLIIPTLHRVQELDRFFASLVSQSSTEWPLTQVEVILVDQNDDDRLSLILVKYQNRLNIRRFRCPSWGQSNAKNEGLAVAQGDWVGFPDDDCYFAPQTLQHLSRAIEKLAEEEAGLFGRVTDPLSQDQPLLRYPDTLGFDIESPRDSRVFLALQVAQFYRRSSLSRIGGFDLELCSGGAWGSGEETDMAIRYLEWGGKLKFLPELVVHHPLVDASTMTLNKLGRYATGFGALCRKHGLTIEWLTKVFKQLAGSVFYFLTLRWNRSLRCAWIAWNRAWGFVRYPRLMPARPARGNS